MTKTMRRSVADSTVHSVEGSESRHENFALLSRLSFFYFFLLLFGASLDLSTASIHDTEGQMNYERLRSTQGAGCQYEQPVFDAHSSGVSAYGRKQVFFSVDDDLRGCLRATAPWVWACSV
ncbi:hypothetical protein J3458_008949 [Metarhizium acridum]|uniref:uncharacterized protein n=1 Tax=Metarhizium acridum TaxID=92637 RepID=UPI001C6AA221|nr:hypothetical protein J3458_008949 [Metarhizium acridum]